MTQTRTEAGRLAVAAAAWLALGTIQSALAAAPAARKDAVAAPKTAARAVTVETQQLRPDLYVLSVGVVNIVVQVGPDGLVVVDPGPAGSAPAVLAAIRQLSPLPIRYVINTSSSPEHVGNNGPLSQAGQSLSEVHGVLGGADLPIAGGASLVAHENTALRMLNPPRGIGPYASVDLPRETYNRPEKNFYINNQAVVLMYQPNAHTDNDSLVFFRRSDVVAAGDLIDMTRFPVINLAEGGSVNGLISALNKLLLLVIPVTPQQRFPGGTLIVPGRGHIGEQAEVVQYRDMVTIIRDRVQDLLDQGKTLEQVKAADPTQGYRSRYGADSGPWTTDMFVEAVYKSLMAAKS